MSKFQRGTPPDQPRRRFRTQINCFRALYDGDCITCDEPFYEGDDVGYIGKNALGVSCNQCILDQEEEDRQSS